MSSCLLHTAVPQYVQMPKGTPKNNFQIWQVIIKISKHRTYRPRTLAELPPRSRPPPPPDRPSGPSAPLRPLRTPPPPPPPTPRTRDRLAPLAPSAPFAHTSRSVMREALALRPNGPNGPQRLRRRLAPNDSPSPNAPPTRDRHAPEPPSACPSPTSQPVTIERHDGPASHAAQA